MRRQTVVVVPCFNEAERLRMDLFLQHARENPETGFLFVDDGSTDATGEILAAAVKRDPEGLAVLSLDRNQGKAEAVRMGICQSVDGGAGAVAYWDADLATPLQELNGMLRSLGSSELVQGVMASRVKLLGRTIERNPFRHYVGRVFATAASMVLRLPVYDTQCGAKVFSVSPELVEAFSEPFTANWIFDVELIGRLKTEWGQSTDGRLVEYPVSQWVDVQGSKVRTRDIFVAALDLFKIWRGLGRKKDLGRSQD